MAPTRAELRAVAANTVLLFQNSLTHDPAVIASVNQTTRIVDLPRGFPQPGPPTTPVEVWNLDTFDAAARLAPAKACVLNMASERTPGGGWLWGASAQEESLCRRSTLALTLAPDRFGAPQLSVPHSYPLDWTEAIYSPDVRVFRDSDLALLPAPFTVDVISMPAQRNPPLRAEESYINDSVMRRKIDMVLTVPYRRGFTGPLVLGAFGCGCFKNPPIAVAKMFREALDRYGGFYSKIVFAIIGPEENRNAFVNKFTK